MVFEGMDTKPPIAENQITIPIPNIPLPEIDSELVSRWLETENDLNLRRIKRKMTDAITNIPFSAFQEELGNVGKKFDEAIGDTPYILLWDNKPHGSKRWVHSLVRPVIESTPRFTSYMKRPEDVIEQLEQHDTNTIVIFDDAIYSGDQLSDSIYVPLWNRLREVNHSKQISMIFGAPFVTEDFKHMIEKRWNDSTIKTTLISSKPLPMLWDILTRQEQDVLKAVDKRLNIPREGDNIDDIRFQPIHFGVTVTTFDHTIPDNFSVCRPLLASVGINMIQRREPYKIKGTPYYDLEKKEYGTWLDDLM